MTHKQAWMGAAGIIAMVASGTGAAGQNTTPLSLSTSMLETAEQTAGHVSVARGTTLRLRGFGVWSDANGSLEWGDDVPGVVSDLDLEDVLGMDLENFTGGFLIGLDFGPDKRAHLEASYDGYYDYEGDRIVGSISVDGNVYTGRVESTYRTHAGMVNLGYDWLRLDRLTVTGNLGLRIMQVDASIREVLTGRSESAELWLPIPTPGLAARIDLTENLYVKGSAAGLWLGSDRYYVELAAELGYDFCKNFGVFVGYRYWGLQLEWRDNHIDLDNGGIYAGVEVRL